MRGPVRWGVLGCAAIAEKVFNGAVQASQTGELHAVASRDLERARQWQERFGFRKAYGSYEALLQDPEVEAVYIPLPNALHREWTLAAVQAGKHVLCEKPAGLTAAEVEAMVAGARQAGVLFAENFAFRFQPQSVRLRELLDQGAIGQVLGLEASFTFRMEERSGDIRLAPALGGGAAYDLGCYPIAFARFVFGREPRSVLAFGDLHPQFQVEMTSAGVLDFGEGRTAAFFTSFEVPGGQRARILGTEGEILLPAPYHPRREDHVIILRRYRPGRSEPEEERIATPVVEPFTAAVDNLGRAIRGQEAPLLPAEDAIAQARVLDAVLQSARDGARVWLG